MVLIGGKPIIWHILKSILIMALMNLLFVAVIKGMQLKNIFKLFFTLCDVTFHMDEDSRMEIHSESLSHGR